MLDRGFTGNTMVATLAQRRRAFCLRVDKAASGWACVSDFLRSGKTEQLVVLGAPKPADAATYELERAPTRVRLIRDTTPSGSVRVLMTSLLDAERYPASAFGALYHRRWRIEEAFKRLKHRLMLETATSLTEHAYRQDFAAKMLADNLHVLLADGALPPPNDDELAAPTCRANRTSAIGILRPILAGCLLRVATCLRHLPTALATIAQSLVRIQPHRQYPRPSRPKPHARLAYKVQC